TAVECPVRRSNRRRVCSVACPLASVVVYRSESGNGPPCGGLAAGGLGGGGGTDTRLAAGLAVGWGPVDPPVASTTPATIPPIATAAIPPATISVRPRGPRLGPRAALRYLAGVPRVALRFVLAMSSRG